MPEKAFFIHFPSLKKILQSNNTTNQTRLFKIRKELT